jgi:hypothetical protein
MYMGCPEMERAVGLGQFSSTGAQVGLTVASTAATFIPVVGPILGPAISIIGKLFGGSSGPTRAQKVSSTIADCNAHLARITTAGAVIDMINKMALPSFGVPGRGWPCAVYKVVKAYAPALIPHECSDQSLVYGKGGDPCAPIPEWLGDAGKKIRATPGWENYIRSFFPPELGGLAPVSAPAIVPTPMPAIPPPPAPVPSYAPTQAIACQTLEAKDFDWQLYLKNNPDVANHPYFSLHPYDHWQEFGKQEGRAFACKTGVSIAIPPSSFPYVTPVNDLVPTRARTGVRDPFSPVTTAPGTSPSWLQPVSAPTEAGTKTIQAGIGEGSLMPILLLGGLAGMLLLGNKQKTRYRRKSTIRHR